MSTCRALPDAALPKEQFTAADSVLLNAPVVPEIAPVLVIAPQPRVPTPAMLPVVSAMVTTESWISLPVVRS